MFLRDAYLQRRRILIYDGDPPPLPADKQSNALPPAGAVAAGTLVEPQLPANYPAVLAADEPLAVAAQ